MTYWEFSLWVFVNETSLVGSALSILIKIARFAFSEINKLYIKTIIRDGILTILKTNLKNLIRFNLY